MDRSFLDADRFFEDVAVTTDDVWTAPVEPLDADAFFSGVVTGPLEVRPPTGPTPTSEAFFGAIEASLASSSVVLEALAAPDGSFYGTDVEASVDRDAPGRCEPPEVLVSVQALDAPEDKDTTREPAATASRIFALDALRDQMGPEFKDGVVVDVEVVESSDPDPVPEGSAPWLADAHVEVVESSDPDPVPEGSAPWLADAHVSEVDDPPRVVEEAPEEAGVALRQPELQQSPPDDEEAARARREREAAAKEREAEEAQREKRKKRAARKKARRKEKAEAKRRAREQEQAKRVAGDQPTADGDSKRSTPPLSIKGVSSKHAAQLRAAGKKHAQAARRRDESSRGAGGSRGDRNDWMQQGKLVVVNPKTSGESGESGGYTALMVVLGILYVLWELFV
jgi:hypothetical protein